MVVALFAAVIAWPVAAQPVRAVDRADYADRLHAMWLGECIANWTGLRTEGARQAPPFLTDADWGTRPPDFTLPIEFVLNQDPWLADDDTDIEYVYLHTMTTLGRSLLTRDEIRDAWLAHMDPNWIWVSDRRAWDLMGRGVRPPMTADPVPNDLWAFIDAQLTTEFFGALCPGMPEEALKYADMPIRTVAFGYAEHAAQFYVVLYALALQVDPSLSGRDKAIWLVREARKWIPDTSNAADIVDFVLADFLSNPDVNDWESTRDKIADRYMVHAAQNGFTYFNWTESCVNFANGVMCLLYGQCDYKRTVQIGTLGGWDSDNCTATMGGLLGLMMGYQQLVAQFPGQSFSDRFNIHRTRINLPDYLPQDGEADDTLTWMAQRMLPLIDANVASAGGRRDGARGAWLLPNPVAGAKVESNPGQREWRRSANCRVPLQGGVVTCATTAPPGMPGMPTGSNDPRYFGNGYETDFTGRDFQDWRKWAYTTEGSGNPPTTPITLSVIYDRPVEVASIRFIEGDHTVQGGWFESAAVQVLVGGIWVTPPATMSEPLDPAKPYPVIDFTLFTPVTATGIRIFGLAGGSASFVTCVELDAMSRQLPLVRTFPKGTH